MRIEPRQIMFIHKIKSIMLQRLQKIHSECWPVFASLSQTIYSNQFKYFSAVRTEHFNFKFKMH